MGRICGTLGCSQRDGHLGCCDTEGCDQPRKRKLSVRAASTERKTPTAHGKVRKLVHNGVNRVMSGGAAGHESETCAGLKSGVKTTIRKPQYQRSHNRKSAL